MALCLQVHPNSCADVHLLDFVMDCRLLVTSASRPSRCQAVFEPQGRPELPFRLCACWCPRRALTPLRAALQGKRAALPSATIMLRQPIQRFQQMQASDIDIYRNELRKTNAEIVRPIGFAPFNLQFCALMLLCQEFCSYKRIVAAGQNGGMWQMPALHHVR